MTYNVKLIDRNILKKFLLIFLFIYIVFIMLYVIGFTIDNLGRLYLIAKDNITNLITLYQHNAVMSVFYIFPFAIIFSLILLYLFFYLRRENVSIFITGYQCVPFKKMVYITLIILAMAIFVYYDFIFTDALVKDKRLMVRFKQNQKYFYPILKIESKDNSRYFIIGKVYNLRDNTVEDIYFYNIQKKIEVFAKKCYIFKDILLFKNVKLLLGQKSKLRKTLVLRIDNIRDKFSKVFSTIEGLNMVSLLTLFNVTGNKVFLFELFKRISYIINGVFVAFILIKGFAVIITKVEFLKYITYFILLTILFISIYFFIFLLAKNLYNLYIGIILWLWSLLIFSIINKRLMIEDDG